MLPLIDLVLNSDSANAELLLRPVIVSRNKNERVLIEGSVNSLRISIKVKQADELDTILTKKFMRFLFQRAESFVVLRRKPVKVRGVFAAFVRLGLSADPLREWWLFLSLSPCRVYVPLLLGGRRRIPR